MILAPEIVLVVYGNQWTESVTVLQILAVFGCVRAVSSINGYIYNAIGKPDITFYLTMSRFVLIAVMIYPSTKLYGIEGAAVAVTVPIVLEFAVGVSIFSRRIALDAMRVFMPLARILLLSGIMAIVVWFSRPVIGNAGIWQLIALIFLGVLTFGVLNQRDIREQYDWLRNRKGT
jgi:O-antigen/teichoic acid export membrane protein